MDTTTTSTRMKPRHSSNKESDEILAGIAHTRAQMDETLDELTERLQPRHIVDDVIDYFRSWRRQRKSAGHDGRHRIRETAGKAAGQVKAKAGDAGRVAARQVREHPLPALLIGAGISLLLMERNRAATVSYEFEDEEMGVSGDFDTTSEGGLVAGPPGPESFALPHHYAEESGDGGTMQKIKGKGAELKHKAGERIHNVKQKAVEKTGQLKQRASEQGAILKEKAWHGYEQSCESVRRTADERPLAVGFGCLALGVLAGLMLPSTRKEDELVGPTRDRLVERSRAVAQDAVERGKHVANTAVQAATEQAREQGLTPERLKEKAQAVASGVVDATREDAQRQQEEFKQEVKQA